MDLKTKKIWLFALMGLFFIISASLFFGTPTTDSSCDFNWTPECDQQEEEFEAMVGPCCISFILMCVCGFWAVRVQSEEKQEENLMIAKNFQEAENERLKSASVQKFIDSKNEEKRIESAKEAEKMRLRKEIEELEKDLDD